MATGTGTLDFGAFPGASDTALAITGQTGILTGSLVEAWIRPAATADHTADEHVVETLKVLAGNIVAGTGFTIYGVNTNQITEPLAPLEQLDGPSSSAGPAGVADERQRSWVGGMGTRLYGTWSVAWTWV